MTLRKLLLLTTLTNLLACGIEDAPHTDDHLAAFCECPEGVDCYPLYEMGDEETSRTCMEQIPETGTDPLASKRPGQPAYQQHDSDLLCTPDESVLVGVAQCGSLTADYESQEWICDTWSPCYFGGVGQAEDDECVKLHQQMQEGTNSWGLIVELVAENGAISGVGPACAGWEYILPNEVRHECFDWTTPDFAMSHAKQEVGLSWCSNLTQDPNNPYSGELVCRHWDSCRFPPMAQPAPTPQQPKPSQF